MRWKVLALLVLVAVVSLACDSNSAPQQKSEPIGKYIGRLPRSDDYTVHVFEHDGNYIYQSYHGKAVVSKRADK